MKAFITSIGEPTTELCKWSLERLGFEVTLLEDTSTTLAQKLKTIYHAADEDFVRVDADVIVNRGILELINDRPDAWWVQGRCYGWYAQGLIHGGVQVIRVKAIPDLRKNIDSRLTSERPESEMYRLPEFHNPRRCASSDIVAGVHGWGQDDIDRVKETKQRRKQYDNYDWDLVERMAAL